MKLLREYIRTLLKEQPDLGNVVFGEDEEDTEYEKKLFKFFSNHFDGRDRASSVASDPALIDNLKSYMSDPRYRGVLKPYSGPCFRGILIDVRDLFRMLLTGDSKVRPNPENLDHFLQKKNSQGFSAHDINYVYKPKSSGHYSLFSHWTKDISVAYSFADTGGVNTFEWGIHYPMLVVMYAQPGQTFLDAQGLYNLPPERNEFAGFRDEKEVVGMGDIQVSRILIKKEGNW